MPEPLHPVALPFAYLAVREVFPGPATDAAPDAVFRLAVIISEAVGVAAGEPPPGSERQGDAACPP